MSNAQARSSRASHDSKQKYLIFRNLSEVKTQIEHI